MHNVDRGLDNQSFRNRLYILMQIMSRLNENFFSISVRVCILEPINRMGVGIRLKRYALRRSRPFNRSVRQIFLKSFLKPLKMCVFFVNVGFKFLHVFSHSFNSSISV